MKGLLQLKTSIYAKLLADNSLISLLGGAHIYDIAQEDAVLPYISYSKIISQTIHDLSSDMVEHSISFVIVAKADSSLTTHNIMERMEVVFDEQFSTNDLNDGYELLSLNVINSQIEQVNFELLKGQLDIRVLIEGDVI